MRIQVNLSEEMIKKLDEYATKMGISRSALCATFIGQGVLGYQKSFEVIDTIGQTLGRDLLEGKKNSIDLY